MLDLRKNSQRPSTLCSNSQGKRISLSDDEFESGQLRDSRTRSLRKGGTIAVGKIGFSNLPSLVYGIIRSSTPSDNNSTGRLHPPLDARTARGDSRSQFLSSLLSHHRYVHGLGQRVANARAPTEIDPKGNTFPPHSQRWGDPSVV